MAWRCSTPAILCAHAFPVLHVPGLITLVCVVRLVGALLSPAAATLGPDPSDCACMLVWVCLTVPMRSSVYPGCCTRA
jgi:hypothetical protein